MNRKYRLGRRQKYHGKLVGVVFSTLTVVGLVGGIVVSQIK